MTGNEVCKNLVRQFMPNNVQSFCYARQPDIHDSLHRSIYLLIQIKKQHATSRRSPQQASMSTNGSLHQQSDGSTMLTAAAATTILYNQQTLHNIQGGKQLTYDWTKCIVCCSNRSSRVFFQILFYAHWLSEILVAGMEYGRDEFDGWSQVPTCTHTHTYTLIHAKYKDLVRAKLKNSTTWLSAFKDMHKE